ncbi:MAG: Myb-like DNA-binding domain-containing protein [Bradyrhizobium sp.]|nr:Myb-like DNA-binding domain-containing protein [Bradyrhizobium sp.]
MMFKKPVGHRQPWTAEEDEDLRRRCAAGETLREIAQALGRTQEGCRSRANKLGVPCRSS